MQKGLHGYGQKFLFDDAIFAQRSLRASSAARSWLYIWHNLCSIQKQPVAMQGMMLWRKYESTYFSGA
jgi:hypothetical protein